ncbi:MAG TPA: PadR family transcriptional regulator [Trebonia sp.]|nr:PadR family transcriptional regulator [Trebonia sp.]
MNLTRLMALGTLARYGPQHGHQIRRLADLTNVGEWGGVSVGALYRELRAMEGEGLVEAVRTEQVGRRPARTVYEITVDGRIELQSLREQAIKPIGFGPDALGVALTFGAEEMDPAELRDTLRARRNRLEITAVELEAELGRLTARGYLGTFQAAMMRRGVMHYQAEVRWHDEFDAELDAAPGPRPALLPGEVIGARSADERARAASSAPQTDKTTET